MISGRRLLTALLAATALAAGAAQAAVLYDNGPSTYQAAAYSIIGNNYAEDSFTIGANSTVTGVEFAVWNSPTYSTTTSVDWAIFSGLRAPYTPEGPLIASGTASVTSSYLLTNTSGYAVNTDTFAIAPTALPSGVYSLELAYAVGTFAGGQISWDVNAGPATALIHTAFGPFEAYGPSNTFQILGSVASAVPETASWVLMLIGFGGLGAVLRRSHMAAAGAITLSASAKP
jgi:hypothetical protein